MSFALSSSFSVCLLANISFFMLRRSYVWGCLCGLDVILSPNKLPCSSLERGLQPAFSGAVISRCLSLNGIVFTCPSKPSENAPKKSACRLVRLGGDSAAQGSGPEDWIAPVTQESKSGYSKQVPVERTGAKLWRAGLLLLSVRQRTAVSGGRGRAGDDWFMGWLAGFVWTCTRVCACMCVRRAHSGWQIGKATDGPGSISTAGCCDVSILLHSPQPARPELSVWLPVRASVFRCLFPSYGCVASKSEPQSLYLPSTIKVKVCLGGTVAEPCRQLTL